jgi:type IV pilus assembly protein PilC
MAEKQHGTETVFLWTGTDRGGVKIKGQTIAKSPILVKAELRSQGITPLQVRKKPKPLFNTQPKKATPKDVTVFSRQLATMIASGVPMVQGLEIASEGHGTVEMRDTLKTVREDVSGGNSLGDSLAKHPKLFDDLFCNLVRSGEASGTLDAMLDRVATYQEKTQAIKSKIKKALFYPIAVIVVAFVVLVVLLLFVVPQFEALFKDFGAQLPAFTRFVIDLSRTFQKWWYIIFGGLAAAGMVFVRARQRSPTFARQVDQWLLDMPTFGSIFTKAAIARYARTLSTMFAAGVPLVDAMGRVSDATGNLIYHDAILRMRDDVATGQRLNTTMNKTQLFPNMVVQMVAIGEESGALDAMLGKVADFYEMEVDDAIDALSSLIEPLIISFLGVVIGGLLVAMYLPIFQMGSII